MLPLTLEIIQKTYNKQHLILLLYIDNTYGAQLHYGGPASTTAVPWTSLKISRVADRETDDMYVRCCVAAETVPGNECPRGSPSSLTRCDLLPALLRVDPVPSLTEAKAILYYSLRVSAIATQAVVAQRFVKSVSLTLDPPRARPIDDIHRAALRPLRRLKRHVGGQGHGGGAPRGLRLPAQPAPGFMSPELIAVSCDGSSK
eukprot:3432384-Pyramimonas_sp.AAC.1